MPREPATIAKWLLIVFAIAVLAHNVAHADASDVVILSFVLLPWFVGPAALAALLAARTKSRTRAWLFVGAEATVVASTASLWIWLLVFKTGPQNAQNGVALILFPIIQFAIIVVYALGVFAVTSSERGSPQASGE